MAGVVALQREEGHPEEPPPEENKAAAAPCPWSAAVAERYERREKLGQGMFGDVYRAWDRVDGRFVAVKRLAGRTGGGFVQAGIRDFAREAMSLAACRGHPAVVELLATYADSARGDGDCFLVTGYAGPVNLRQYMALRRREGPPLDEDEVRDAMRQLLAGVKRAHGAGVLHRDVVPENVIVGQEDVIAAGDVLVGRKKMVYKICGFGMSEPAAQAEKDGSGPLASPAPYRAPELFLSSKDYDGRVDTWGLGCIMAELLAGTGEPFFGGKLDTEVFERMLRVVGAKGIVTWSGLERVAASDRADYLRKHCRKERGCLREVFPREVLSPAGFEVLKGLLRSNPERRLTAAAALRKPWFRRPGFGGCFGPCGGGASP
ncbi:putative cyclin-dependent kinase F-2 [Panicum virgatum]|uniref:[RNA-polymerase]-subunit kinase n=1 Tax=Panicum virgatum TaxID=38727 RepID=A0A8T0P7S4_PANVG|nr:putative cyclin-dependent kinase F-2 [Panicum virgatum]KAG2557660.1 hypothetical protein PVAP13_8NG254101 [Panicum virgatum]